MRWHPIRVGCIWQTNNCTVAEFHENKMKVRVLGCSGGIGGRDQRTTALLVDDDVLIDAGTGVGDLEFDELLRIDHVFVTHAHLDHIAMIPLLVDTVGEARSMPIVVHGSPETLRILRSHIFNWLIWPDFSSIPRSGNRSCGFRKCTSARAPTSAAAAGMTALPALHTVPAVAYQVSCDTGSLVFSGDTTYSRAADRRHQRHSRSALPAGRDGVSRRPPRSGYCSRHLCPSSLALFLDRLVRRRCGSRTKPSGPRSPSSTRSAIIAGVFSQRRARGLGSSSSSHSSGLKVRRACPP